MFYNNLMKLGEIIYDFTPNFGSSDFSKNGLVFYRYFSESQFYPLAKMK